MITLVLAIEIGAMFVGHDRSRHYLARARHLGYVVAAGMWRDLGKLSRRRTRRLDWEGT